MVHIRFVDQRKLMNRNYFITILNLYTKGSPVQPLLDHYFASPCIIPVSKENTDSMVIYLAA